VLGVQPAIGAHQRAGQQELVIEEALDLAQGADQRDRGVVVFHRLETVIVEGVLVAVAERVQHPD